MYIDAHEHIETVWGALHNYREKVIPPGPNAGHDEEWDDICGAMASLRELLEEGGHLQPEIQTEGPNDD